MNNAARQLKDMIRKDIISLLAHGLFRLQLEVYFKAVLGASRFISLCCGRRSGKTVVLSRIAGGVAASHPKRGITPSLVAVCYPTLDRAVRIFWPHLMQLAIMYGWRIETTRHRVILPNGAEIWLIGLDSQEDTGKLLGNPFLLVIIDESQSIRPDFATLIDKVIGPTLEDYNGSILLSGTPSTTCHGYWYDACHDTSYTNFTWSIYDNPMLPAWAGHVDWRMRAEQAKLKLLERKHWQADDPRFVTEYLGLWKRDTSKLVFARYDPRFNDFTELPKKQNGHDYHWSHIFGMDLGYENSFAFGVLAFSYDCPNVYELEAHEMKHSTMTDWGLLARTMKIKYPSVVSMVADEGGLGKASVIEINKRFGLNIKAAEKTSKWTFIELVNDQFSERRLFVRPDSPTKDQLLSLTKAKDAQGQYIEGREDPGQPNDLTDQLLYGVRESRHYLAKKPELVPQQGTREYELYMQAKIDKEFLDAYEDERRMRRSGG